MSRNLRIPFIYIINLCLLLLVSVAVVSFTFPDQETEIAPPGKILNVYPNPAVSYINFEFSSEVDQYHQLIIYNFVGKKMVEVPINNSKLTIYLNNYYRGLYIYQLRDKAGKILETGKFQVNS